jgi:penicillin V acylase-like amidase (Ntn superfamily)
MKNHRLFFIFYVSLICLIPKVNHACTGFNLSRGEQQLVGRNTDWYIDDCLIIVNKRGVQKTALQSPPKVSAQPAKWTSKYGSLTFNQFGCEQPFSGMNETGLVVQLLALAETKFPTPDSHPSINQLQWVQYQLDNFSTVKEVIASVSELRITKRDGGLGNHLLVCDSMGNCAVIEFLDGKIVHYTNESMPVNVLTNNTYAESVESWKSGKLPTSDDWRSLERFTQAANMIKNYDPKPSRSAVDYAFDILTKVEMGDPIEAEGKRMRSSFIATEWSIVYDMHNLKSYFRTFENQKIRFVNLTKFDFSCKNPMKVLNIHTDLSGDVTNNFIDYTQKINRKLIENAYRKVSLKNIPKDELEMIFRYPGSIICTDK